MTDPGSDYRRILAVLDLKDDSRVVGRRAATMAEHMQAELVLLHVVEYVPIEPMGETLLPSVEVERELLRRAEADLAHLATELGIGGSRQLVVSGSTKTEILRAARTLPADLIVLGSRERHGLAIMVNFTEDTVLHAAPCDVLAVRLH
jgi:universal stress protein A